MHLNTILTVDSRGFVREDTLVGYNLKIVTIWRSLKLIKSFALNPIMFSLVHETKKFEHDDASNFVKLN